LIGKVAEELAYTNTMDKNHAGITLCKAGVFTALTGSSHARAGIWYTS